MRNASEMGGKNCSVPRCGLYHVKSQLNDRHLFYRTGYYRPQGPVKADKSILNFGSPRPPVKTVPLGLGTCCNLDCASRK